MESTRDSVVAETDIEENIGQIQSCADAGYDELYLATMGPR
ncbi:MULTISPECIES: hypothetical protein [unclassified Nocardioides]|nr:MULTISPECIES: hypothetical protein [unclassified Nocardioides]